MEASNSSRTDVRRTFLGAVFVTRKVSVRGSHLHVVRDGGELGISLPSSFLALLLWLRLRMAGAQIYGGDFRSTWTSSAACSRQIFIIGLWGEKDDDKLLADDGFLAAVGADGKLRNCSAQQARFARAWHTQDRAVGSVDLPLLFRLQWDVWHSCWLWSAAWIDENRPRLDGGQSHFDVWPRWLAETSDGAEAAFSSRESPGIGDDEPELLWAAGGDGGDHGWLFCPQAATDVQEFELDAAWMSACMESRAPQRGPRSEGRRPATGRHVARCCPGALLYWTLPASFSLAASLL